ncbi:MAG: hypothetical protein ACPG32_03665 [Akkermansiaceae bacterium]
MKSDTHASVTRSLTSPLRNLVPATVLLLALICLALPSLQAQDQPSGADETRGKPTFKISTIGEWKNKALFYRSPTKGSDKKEAKKLELLDMGYSPSYVFKRGTPIQLLQETGNTEKPYRTALQINVPETIRQPLILLIQLKGKLTFRLFDLNPKKFPFGSIQSVNFSSHELQVALNKKIVTLKPSNKHIFPAIKEAKKQGWLRVATKKNNKLVFSSMMMRRAKKRILIFFINGKNGEAVETRMLVDFKPAPAG